MRHPLSYIFNNSRRLISRSRTCVLTWAGFALTVLPSCTPEEEVKTLHVFNPFEAEGISAEAAGHAPFFHGEYNGFGLTQMVKDGDCGWYTLQFTQTLGDFRFMGSDWNGPQWGKDGLNSEINFNTDALFKTSGDVYAEPDLAAGSTYFTTDRPFDCGKTASPTVENPFNQGTLPANASPSHAKTYYETWLSNFYEEEGNLARIRFDEPSETVSEGIGYGMLIFVYADDPEARSRFDKLLAYHDKYVGEAGLMHWKINGFGEVSGSGGATDADLDIATALILASRKWAEPAYLNAAQTIITSLRVSGFEATGYLKSGDRWQDGESLNPSYFSFVAFQLFSEVDTDNSSFWNDAIERHYQTILGGRDTTTGLIANWTDSAGAPQQPPATTPYPDWADFGFDAMRVPWRAGWAALWYGDNALHAPAASIASDLCDFAATTSGGDPSALNSSYTLAGTPTGIEAGVGAIGAFGVACTMNSAQDDFLNASYNLLRTKTASYDVTYYQTSLQVLEALLLSGEMTAL